MRANSIITPAALALALSIGAGPAFADMLDQNQRARPRETVGRTAGRQQPEARPESRGRVEQNAPRGRDNRAVAREPQRNVAPSRDGRYDARRYQAPRYQYRAPSYRYRGLGGLFTGLGLSFNLGGLRVGIIAGRPFPYRYAWSVPAYRYSHPIRIVSGVRYGGIALRITPAEAGVYVDGYYVGMAQDFYGDDLPLPLTPGVHRIELEAGGFAPMVFDVDVMPGQVIPYEGSMRPLR